MCVCVLRRLPPVLGVCALAGFLSLGSSEGVKAQTTASRAKAPTTEQRLQAVEDKTSFYVNTTSKVLLSYRKGRAASTPWQCAGNLMITTADPKLKMAGTSYSWTTATIKFSALGSNPDMTFSVGVANKNPYKCPLAGPIRSTSGTYRKYCQLEVEPRDKFQFTIEMSNEDGDLVACDHVTAADVQLKLVNVGIEEPK